ncbi:MAG: chemotaxis protein CheW [Elusimicrobiales bacterium]
MNVVEEKNSKIGGKFLTFFLDKEEYGIEILKVQEIIGVMPVTPIPKMPDYVKGVINLRGRIIPVIDLRLKLSMPSAPLTEETCFIVVKSQNIFVGVIVDRVSEVTDISGENIENTPDVALINSDYIMGIGKENGKVRILLDIDKVLTQEEAKNLKKAISQEVK